MSIGVSEHNAIHLTICKCISITGIIQGWRKPEWLTVVLGKQDTPTLTLKGGHDLCQQFLEARLVPTLGAAPEEEGSAHTLSKAIKELHVES